METEAGEHGVAEATVEDVRETFVRMFADPQVRATCEAFAAEVLERAASHGSARWVVSLRGPTRINVSVGRAYVLALSKETLRVPVDPEAMDPGAIQALAALATVTDEVSLPRFRGHPSSLPPS